MHTGLFDRTGQVFMYDARIARGERTRPSRPRRVKVTREWMTKRIWTGKLSDQIRALREWARNGTNVRLTPSMPFEAVLLHQRISQRGTKSILKAHLGLEGLWSV